MDDRISAVTRISALLSSKENETCADDSSDEICFCYVLGKKTFLLNVL
jgi:hypothetical protein